MKSLLTRESQALDPKTQTLDATAQAAKPEPESSKE
eukprot:CAMPEP_0184296726 /NCGR_PEP_ID=MMETSP1049-20130417/7696_1 /TAXON_ID=77928 /ORGANISM="Proteomonas sulcata, Strain CCMP704" /LENGTH=35 /DNA_ID= /DNA_START= /DNA_END= /DNA_ORIENTATION=